MPSEYKLLYTGALMDLINGHVVNTHTHEDGGITSSHCYVIMNTLQEY